MVSPERNGTAVANLVLRGIPEELHRELKAAAKRGHRSLNGEILARLATSVRMAPVEAAVLLERIRRRNRSLGPVNLDEPAPNRVRDESRQRWKGGE